MDTKILSEDEKILFRELLIKHSKYIGNCFDLLYRGSSDNPKFDGTNCFKKLHGNSGTVTLIETEKGNVFGVYTDLKWNIGWSGLGKWYHDKNAFCFLLRSTANHPPNIFEHNYEQNGRDEFTIQTWRRYLCIFGLWGTINILDGGKGSVAERTTSFTMPGNCHLNGGHSNFDTKEYEVWNCSKF